MFDYDGGDIASDEELREFLEADDLDIEADPFFKESLRRKLWEIVKTRYAAAGPTDGAGDPPGPPSRRDPDPDADA